VDKSLNMGFMTRRFRKLLFGVQVVALSLLSVSVGAASTVVTDIRVGAVNETTRIVFEFTERLSFRVFTLADPYRVVIDMPEVGWRLPARPLPGAAGVYDKLRYGLYKPGNSRVVLDLLRPARIAKAAMLAPNGAYGYRLVLEMKKASRGNFLAAVKAGGITVSGDALGKPMKTAKSDTVAPRTKRARAKTAKVAARPAPNTKPGRFQLAPRKPALRPSSTKYTVVIDPGHGGVDPGAVGGTGSYEKHITLSMARAIREALNSFGHFKVKLTRDRDIFIQLRDRIQIAREAGADLFISVHADSIKNKKISGPSVYTLSENASDKEAAALADKENKADLIAGIDLTHNSQEVANILIDLAQRDAMNQSARFASLLVREMEKRTKVLRNTHRFAGFAVLKAPDVPSVLLELGFLSNRRDERALMNGGYRKKLAIGVARAVNTYFQRVEQAARR